MNEEKTNIVPYNTVSGGAPQPPKDYSNSNRSKMASLGKPTSGPPAASRQPQREVMSNDGGFFKATLKQAIDHAITTVIDPMVRNFVYSTGMSILNTLLWNGGKGSPGVPFFDGKIPYNQISTSIIGGQTSVQKQPQMTQQDRVWQNYQKLHVDTLDKANAIMSKLYRMFMRQGQVTLAQYYDAFGERYGFEDENWGWTTLPKEQMYAQQFSDGYHVIMPKLVRLQ